MITQEAFEKRKVKYAEKVKSRLASTQKRAEEKKKMAEARCSKEVLKVEAKATKYRSTGRAPKKIWTFFVGLKFD